MKIKMILAIGCLSVATLLSACNNQVDISPDNAPTATTEGCATVTRSINGGVMDVVMDEKMKFAAGNELWEKGEEIIFTVSSDFDMELEIGIYPVTEDGGYGEFISKTIKSNQTQQEVSIIVPETGEYGLGFVNKTDKSVAFKVDINKTLENPLV